MKHKLTVREDFSAICSCKNWSCDPMSERPSKEETEPKIKASFERHLAVVKVNEKVGEN